jgi:hypothetical protein
MEVTHRTAIAEVSQLTHASGVFFARMLKRGLFLLVLLAIPVVTAHAQQDKNPNGTFAELTLFTGGSLKPAASPTFGGAFGVGWGERPTITFEYSHTSLHDEVLGWRPDSALGPPFSDSRLQTITGNFQFDVFRRSVGRRLAPYAVASGGVFYSKFTAPLIACCFIPRTPTKYDRRSFAAGGGGGLRIAITRAFGIRPEIKIWKVGGGSPELFLHTATAIQATVGIYFRGY